MKDFDCNTAFVYKVIKNGSEFVGTFRLYSMALKRASLIATAYKDSNVEIWQFFIDRAFLIKIL